MCGKKLLLVISINEGLDTLALIETPQTWISATTNASIVNKQHSTLDKPRLTVRVSHVDNDGFRVIAVEGQKLYRNREGRRCFKRAWRQNQGAQ